MPEGPVPSEPKSTGVGDRALKPATAPAADADLLEQIEKALQGAADRAAPAVVTIHVDRQGADRSDGDPAVAGDAWISDGSGTIIRRDGSILTCQHVVEGAMAVNVTLPDGSRHRATVVASDARADLAVLRIRAKKLSPAEIGDATRLRPGSIVLALGNPFGLAVDGQVAMSQGIVSAVGRPLPDAVGREDDRYYGDMIQTTAYVGPGSSGGPLIDVRGRLVGVLSVMASADQTNRGPGFAIPINDHTRGIIDRLLAGQPMAYGYLGAVVRTMERTARLDGNPPTETGIVVDSIVPQGPADLAGLRPGDLVVSLDGRPVPSPDAFIRQIGDAGPDAEVAIEYLRAGERRSARARLVRRLPERPPAAALGRTVFRGATLTPLDPAVASLYNLPSQALLVLAVDVDTPAHRAGLMPGDIVVRIDGEPVSRDSAARLAVMQGDVLLGLAHGGSVLVKR